MNRKKQFVLGSVMLAAPVIGAFVFTQYMIGTRLALLAFVIAAVVIAWIVTACRLITRWPSC